MTLVTLIAVLFVVGILGAFLVTLRGRRPTWAHPTGNDDEDE